jgi:molybdate transport system substrate-binding protein
MRTFLVLVAYFIPIIALAHEVTVAVASNFTAPMKVIAQAFENDTGYKTKLAFGATGQLYAQIKNGAPFQVFLAADEKAPAQLVTGGIAVVHSQFTYATGRLVLWSKTPGLINETAEVLKRGGFNKIAIANPKLAPYGAAAMEVIEKMGLASLLTPRLVEGSNIGQTLQFVSSGNAQVGFVALSQVFDNGRLKEGSGWIVPLGLHKPLQQNAVLLKAGQQNPAAEALMSYLRSNRALAIIRSFGYDALAPQ